MRRIHGFGRGVLAAAVLAALGAGVSAAFATPVEASRPVCRTYECRTACIAGGAIGGACIEGYCECFF